MMTDRLCGSGRFTVFAGSSSCFAASLILLQGPDGAFAVALSCRLCLRDQCAGWIAQLHELKFAHSGASASENQAEDWV